MPGLMMSFQVQSLRQARPLTDLPPQYSLCDLRRNCSVSVGKLFLGGVIPGLAMMAALMIMIFFYALNNRYPRTAFLMRIGENLLKRSSPADANHHSQRFVIGLFTPTEASAVAVFYALLVGGLL
jgi:TRAP-type C4-dicarboxylate transport system permease large subunit